ncbi:hypothetical protein MHB77_30170 [Paenibacillus sp. FSL K6-3166]|uniref:hypothetical protein n=1 Tax=Paenibacillus sp. FSL K6-3166 TaxID=2921492 RepID=UPI0030F54C36
MELENDEIHIVLRHFQIYSSVEKTFTKKDFALKYAAEMDKLENNNLPDVGGQKCVPHRTRINCGFFFFTV